MLTMLDVAPELVVCDLHPDYRSTRFAEAMELPILRVQHHAAHLAAVAAEHHLQRTARRRCARRTWLRR